MLRITDNAGFFSCCSVKLYRIIDYFNKNNKLPDDVDSSKQFEWYKLNNSLDITYDYFDCYNKHQYNIHYEHSIDYHWDHQYIEYSKLNYKTICPFVRKYFSPSEEILQIVKNIELKYNIIDYSNICVLFYRGNDKVTETPIAPYEEFIQKANDIKKMNPLVKFLIQSDETEFIDKIKTTFSENSFYFNDEIRHMSKCCSTVDKIYKDTNYKYSKFYLAITIIMSKCNYIVCGSGNCSIWIMLYKEHANGVYQNLNNMWV